MSRTRVTGALLFLPIPLVLVLYLRRPLGLGASLACGVALMLGHRFVAKPFVDRFIARRCFWCGRDLDGPGYEAPFCSGTATVPARACSTAHAESVSTFARAVASARIALRVFIMIPVVVYLGLAVLTLFRSSPVTIETAVWFFKVPIAAAVVGLSFCWPLGARTTRAPAIDFPSHNLALLGVRNTLWVFRVVGIIWLAQAVLAAAWRPALS